MKNLFLGMIFTIVSIIFLSQSKNLLLGSLTKMGPAFFAFYLSIILILLGIILLIKGFRDKIDPKISISFKRIWFIFIFIIIFTLFVNTIPLFVLLTVLFLIFIWAHKYVF